MIDTKTNWTVCAHAGCGRDAGSHSLFATNPAGQWPGYMCEDHFRKIKGLPR